MSLVSDAFAKQNEKNPQNTQNPNRLLSGGALFSCCCCRCCCYCCCCCCCCSSRPFGEMAFGSFARKCSPRQLLAPFLLAALSPFLPVLSAGSVESSDMRKSSSSLTARKMKSLSRVQLFVTPWTLTYQPPPSMGFSRQEYWSGLPFLSPISSQPRDRTRVSHIVGRCFTV